MRGGGWGGQYRSEQANTGGGLTLPCVHLPQADGKARCLWSVTVATLSSRLRKQSASHDPPGEAAALHFSFECRTPHLLTARFYLFFVEWLQTLYKE